MPEHVIVLGAGISGLSAAWRLSTNGVPVDIFESSPFVGGLAASVRKDHCCVDFGPHSFFSEDQEVLNTVLVLFDTPLQSKSRSVKFYYNSKYLDYPLTAKNILLQMGFLSGIQATASFLKGKLSPRLRTNALKKDDETVEDWAIANFGEYIYRKFFKPYTEQFWKVPCTELSSRAIPTHTRMSFMNTLRLLLHQKMCKTGESLIEREMLPTYYPPTGFGEIAEKIAKMIEKNKGHIHLNSTVVRIAKLPSGKFRIEYYHNGHRKDIEGDYIISTIPLPLLVKMLNPDPPPHIATSIDTLDYRALIVLGMLTNKQNILNCGYLYVLDRPFNRISEMNEFSPQTSPRNENILCVEIPCLQNSIAWTATKEELFDMCVSSLAKDSFLNAGDVKRLFLVKAPYAYPVYRKNYAPHLTRLLDYVHDYAGITTLGRSGEFMYMDIDKCIRRAFNAADDLLTKDLHTENRLRVHMRQLDE